MRVPPAAKTGRQQHGAVVAANVEIGAKRARGGLYEMPRMSQQDCAAAARGVRGRARRVRRDAHLIERVEPGAVRANIDIEDDDAALLASADRRDHLRPATPPFADNGAVEGGVEVAVAGQRELVVAGLPPGRHRPAAGGVGEPRIAGGAHSNARCFGVITLSRRG